MIIIEDTRQQIGKHELKHRFFSVNKIRLVRSKLPFGDYSAPPRRVIDTKENMLEIVGNICGSSKEHARVREECKLARDCGAELIFLIENDEGITCIADVAFWENPRKAFSSKAADGTRVMKTMITMSERYGCKFMFCKPEESGKVIKELLYDNVEHSN